jgi:catalase-peroxidase
MHRRQTDVESFAVLEPTADGFRNYLGQGQQVPAEYLLVERAQMLTLTAPEMTVLWRHARPGCNAQQSAVGVFTKRTGTLTNDFFVNLLDMDTSAGRPLDPPKPSRSAPQDGRAQVDRQPRRSHLGSNPAPCPRGGLRVRRCQGTVRARLRAAWDKVMNRSIDLV